MAILADYLELLFSFSHIGNHGEDQKKKDNEG
jgi:hypothetical protein